MIHVQLIKILIKLQTLGEAMSIGPLLVACRFIDDVDGVGLQNNQFIF